MILMSSSCCRDNEFELIYYEVVCVCVCVCVCECLMFSMFILQKN